MSAQQPHNPREGAGPPSSSPAAAPLFTPYTLPGGQRLSHRVVFPPMTRGRALGGLPQPCTAIYYGERATKGGLMLTEGTVVADTGFGTPHAPGIFTAEQVEAWRPVTKAVKDKGAIFFCQLWHGGRASHPDYQPGGAAPISSGTRPISDGSQCFSPVSMQMVDYPVPRQLAAPELPAVAALYAAAARNALDAGFDGVEVHGAYGCLIDQFIKDGINNRTDEYGGPIENRCRFPLEVLQAVCAEIGPERVGLRLSPFGGYLDAKDSTPYATTTYLLEKLNGMGLCYVSLVEPRVDGNMDVDPATVKDSLAPFRQAYRGTLVAAGGYNAASGGDAVASGHCDLVCFGRHYLANPDLVRRFQLGAPLNKYNRGTFYTHSEEGYIDYPFLEGTAEGQAFLAAAAAQQD